MTIKKVGYNNVSDCIMGLTTPHQFAEERYGLDLTAGGNLYQFNRAISSGVENGVFSLPKGPSGKVKMAPKTKAGETKEVWWS